MIEDLSEPSEPSGPSEPGSPAVGGPRAHASYVSTPVILEREARALARRQLSTPGVWRRFGLRRLGVAVAAAALLTLLVATDRATLAGAGRGGLLLLVALALLTALDAWLIRRRVLRAHRTAAIASCPPGTVVAGTYALDEITFALPGHRVVVVTAAVTEAIHEGRLLLLHQDDGRAWVVPDELLGDGGLDVVRAALGPRLEER